MTGEFTKERNITPSPDHNRHSLLHNFNREELSAKLNIHPLSPSVPLPLQHFLQIVQPPPYPATFSPKAGGQPALFLDSFLTSDTWDQRYGSAPVARSAGC